MVNKEPIDADYPYIRLKYSWDMILSLQDFIDCIGLHKTSLKSPRNIGLMQFRKDFFNDHKFNPGGVLKDYVYLEVSSFFKYAKELKMSKGDKNLPELPSYVNELEKFRDVMVGHRDRKEKVKFPDGWIVIQEKTAKSIPIATLIKDVNAYYQEVVKRHKESSRNKI